MAKNASYRVKLRRRREGKTDYQARKALVSSRKPRLVTRASIKNVEVQIINAKPHGDMVLASANSRELIESIRLESSNRQHPRSLPDRVALRFEGESFRHRRSNS